MSETLLVHYNIEQAQQASWAVCNDAGELTSKINTGTLDELGENAAALGCRVIVLLNSQCLHINQLQLPTTNQQKMLKAIPFAIEEFIAEDIENFHFVMAKNKPSNLTAVVGIDKITLQNIVQIFQQINISIEKIIPDVLCLPATEQQWVFLNYLDYSYLQTDALNGMVLSHDVLPYIISSKLQDESQKLPEKFLLFTEQDNSDAFDQLVLDGEQKEGESQDDEQRDGEHREKINIVYSKHPLVVFCGHYKQALVLNLLQHEFKNKRKSSVFWQHWRLAASLAVIGLVISLALSHFQYAQIKTANASTQTEIENIFKQAFPENRRIVNARVQMEQNLNALKRGAGNNNGGLIFLLSESFGALGTVSSNISLQSLTFRNNRMNISLESNTLQAIENLNKSLNSSNEIKSEITSSSSEKNKVRGNLRIETHTGGSR